MPKFQLPDDFNPDFIKVYPDLGFTIQLQSKGLQGPDQSHWLWLFAILVNGTVIDSGPFRWSVSWRELTEESVANNIASFYKDTTSLIEAIEKSRKEDDLKPQAVPRNVNDELFIFKAMALVWSVFYSTELAESLDLFNEFYVVSYCSVLDNKSLIIGTKSNTDITYEITYEGAAQRTTVVSFLETQRYTFNRNEFDPQDL